MAEARADREPARTGRPSFVPVDRESTPSIIARKLREAISTGEYPQGMQLVEADIAATLSVSRGPLREAMQRLTQEGIVLSERNRGLFVMTLGPDDVRDVYLARLAVESAAAEALIASGPQSGCIYDLRARLEELAAVAGDEAASSAADLRFHETLVALAASPRLSRMHATLLTETRMCLTALATTYDSRAGDRLAEHTAIVDAIATRDHALTVARLRAHADDALVRLVALG